MFEPSPRGKQLLATTAQFLEEHVYPAERRWSSEPEDPHGFRPQPAVLEDLKLHARSIGLWNLFLPHPEPGHEPLTNLDYAPIAELTGRSIPLAPESMNCSAPDTGNMELLSMFGTPEQKSRWLVPLLEGRIRSAYAMTEPDLASSDAGNIQTAITRDGDSWVVDGHKWWITGIRRDRCELLIVMGITGADAADRHRRHSIVLVPRDTPGVEVREDLSILGNHTFESHAVVSFENVRVPAANLLGDAGAGFAMAQARLGPGRIHHCMRMIGMAERALELMIDRVRSRSTFGRPLSEQGVVREWIADARIEIDQARLYTLYAAHLMDTVGNRAAASQISGIKVAVPNMTCRVLDRAMQVFGAAGLGPTTPLARMYVEARAVRIADGPDEIHRRAMARTELRSFDRLVHPRPTGAQSHLLVKEGT
ncbi:acyl-CoA dehydrogenase family protein [Aeromicrobium sp. CTD01-1L150]|uniref:acyl-CoA dehydrogenase family protein n=1 Tax=Aeromicrobium sp. CTD01-1L150 TaxID=3341830 RepID=UPI0035C06616